MHRATQTQVHVILYRKDPQIKICRIVSLQYHSKASLQADLSQRHQKPKALHQSAIFLVRVIFHGLFTFSIRLAVALLEKGHLNLCQRC